MIDGETRNELIQDNEANARFIKPVLGGRDLKRYENPSSEKYLILIPDGWTNRQRGSQDAWSYLCEHHRAIAVYLEQFRDAAMKRGDKGDYWWELRPCDYYDVFEQSKIMLPDISLRGNFILDTTGGKYCTNTAYIIGSDDKYLLGILNSKLITFFCSNVLSTYRGGYLRFFLQYLERIPIRTIDFDSPAHVEMHDEMVKLVDEMLDLRRQLARVSLVKRGVIEQKIEATDEKIDALVYRLYGLSGDEREIVEGG